MKSTTEFAIQAGELNDKVFASLDSRPREAAEHMAAFAGQIAAESARREAMGEPSLIGFNWSDSASVDALSNQIVALARQASALARADGQGPEGQSWGAFKTFFEVVGSEGKSKILEDLESMRAANPAWHNAMLDLGLQEGLRSAISYKSANGVAKGAPRRPADEPAPIESVLNEKWSNMHGGSVELAFQSTPERSKESLSEFYQAVSEIKMDVAEHQARTGVNWRDQAFSKRFIKSNDIQFSTLANTIMAVAQRSEVDPAADPRLGASLTALASMMSRSESVHFAVSIANRSDLAPAWKSFAVDLANSPAGSGKWFAGLASDGPVFIPGKPELLIPASVEFGAEKAYVEKAYPQAQQQAPIERLGFKVGRVLSGFVSNFRAPSFTKPSFSFSDAVPEFNALAGMQGNGGRASLKSKISSLGDGLRMSVVGAIEQANAFTDFVETGIRAGVGKVYGASTGAVDGAAQKASSLMERVSMGMAGAVIGAREKIESAYGASAGIALGTREGLASAFDAAADKIGNSIDKANAMVDRAGMRATNAVLSAGDRVAGAYESSRGALDAGVEKANALTDKMEQVVKNGARKIVDGSLSAVESVAAAAKDQREQFVGRVGVATEAAGMRLGEAVLGVKDRLPGAQDPAVTAQRQKAVAKIAGIAGMLFVGVAMAPVVGLLAATAGGIAAGIGFASAARKAVAGAAGASDALPSALESIGAKLGAKRQAMVPVRIEPSLAKPQQMPG